MKKIIITLFFALGCYTLATAQSNSNIEFGANVGYNESYISLGPSSAFNSAAVGGFNAGIYADKYFSDRWSIKLKLNYDQKGYGYNYYTYNVVTYLAAGSTYTSYSNSGSIKLNYLTVPVMANWHFGRGRNWYLNFGPYVGFLLSSQNSGYNPGITNAFNTVDAGLALGIGVKFQIAPNLKLFIEEDGQGGVTSIYKPSEGFNAQNARSSINVGLNFGL